MSPVPARFRGDGRDTRPPSDARITRQRYSRACHCTVIGTFKHADRLRCCTCTAPLCRDHPFKTNSQGDQGKKKVSWLGFLRGLCFKQGFSRLGFYGQGKRVWIGAYDVEESCILHTCVDLEVSLLLMEVNVVN
jgi:hypothetical protein